MRFWKYASTMLIFHAVAWSNIGPQGFHDHLNGIFVETGTFAGDGIQKALDAGFPFIFSLDIDRPGVIAARKRFEKNPQVRIFIKDSSTQLSEVIKGIQSSITFWLDAHNGWADPNGGKNTALLGELEQIKQHPIKTHTIMIDDLHCCDTILFDHLSLTDIVSKVQEINPDYIFSFEPGGDQGEYPRNVLVATPPLKY